MEDQTNSKQKLLKKINLIPDKCSEGKEIESDIYNYPLSPTAKQVLNRMFKEKSSDKDIFRFVKEKHRKNKLVQKNR